MAIVKMKRLRLLAMQRDRDALLRMLQRTGCVEIRQPEIPPDDPVWAHLTQAQDSALAQARDRHSAGEHALETLRHYAPAKKPLLSPRPTVSEAEMFGSDASERGREAVASINEAQRKVDALRARIDKLTSQRELLAPWRSLDVPLDTQDSSQVAVRFGTVPANVPITRLELALQSVSELGQLTLASTDRELHYLLLVCHISVLEDMMSVLKENGWSRSGLRDYSGTAEENDRRLQKELEECTRQLTQAELDLSAQGGKRELVEQEIDRATVDAGREDVYTRLLDTGSTFYLEGWLPAEKWAELQLRLIEYPCAWEITDPAPEEYPEVPVALRNNKFTGPLSMVTDMYSLPAYGSVDPNPLMAPFFIVFYGMMMADMGYGIVMMALALLVVNKARPNGPTMRYMFPLMGWCGLATFLFGMATGSFFGDMIPQLIRIFNPESTFELPSLFSPTKDALAVLIGSLVLGVIQIFTGMAVSVYRKCKRGEVMAAVCNEGAWYATFLCAGVGIATGHAKGGFLIALVILVLTQGYGKEGIVGKLMGIGGSLYSNITGYFSDILSYSRLMALMLAGAVIAQVFNTIGAITGNVITFFVISLIGNGLNLALNLLGCFVHDMRLQCLEYFGRFYEDGGKPFRPLEINTRFVEVGK